MSDVLAGTTTVSGTPTPATIELVTAATLQTFLNGVSAINTFQMGVAWSNEAQNLQAIQALPLVLDPFSQAFLPVRATTYEVAAAALNAIVPALPFPLITASIVQGLPAIPDPGLTTFYGNFAFEAPVIGTTGANLAQQSQLVATSFSNIAAAIQALQGQFLTSVFDTAVRQGSSAQYATNVLNDFTSGPLSPNISVTTLWNQNVVLPTFVVDGGSLNSTPYLLSTQQSCVIRYAMLGIIQQLSAFLLVLRAPNASQPTIATLGQGQSLLDLANTALGNYEAWPQIAQLNNLQPPYVSTNNASGTATFGQQLIMPTPGAAPSSTGAPPNYNTNFLGIDLYLGPLNQPMLPWTGDFPTIAGLQNLQISLGRRLQTTLGTLIYHPDYGSRIPPEVGSIQDSQSAGQIAAFGESAIMGDPRVASVQDAAAIPQPNSAIAFSASVVPAGFGTGTLSVNEVIGPVA